MPRSCCRKRSGLPALSRLRRLTCPAFHPAANRPERPFTVGRLSRDQPFKHHREDPMLYLMLAEQGCVVGIMGGTVLHEPAAKIRFHQTTRRRRRSRTGFPTPAGLLLLPHRRANVRGFRSGGIRGDGLRPACSVRTARWLCRTHPARRKRISDRNAGGGLRLHPCASRKTSRCASASAKLLGIQWRNYTTPTTGRN